MTEIDLLRLINQKEPMRYSDIYKSMGITTKEISTPMARLKKKKLVRRVDVPGGPLWICTEDGLRMLEVENGGKTG